MLPELLDYSDLFNSKVATYFSIFPSKTRRWSRTLTKAADEKVAERDRARASHTYYA